jgi:hypothetical protein
MQNPFELYTEVQKKYANFDAVKVKLEELLSMWSIIFLNEDAKSDHVISEMDYITKWFMQIVWSLFLLKCI